MENDVENTELYNILSNTLDTSNSASIIDKNIIRNSTHSIRGIVAGDGVVLSLIDTSYPDGLGYSIGKTIQISTKPSDPTPSTPSLEKIHYYSDTVGTEDSYYELPDDYTIFLFAANGTNYVIIPENKPNGYKIKISNYTGQTFSGNVNIKLASGNFYNFYGGILPNINQLSPGQSYTIITDGNNNWYQQR